MVRLLVQHEHHHVSVAAGSRQAGVYLLKEHQAWVSREMVLTNVYARGDLWLLRRDLEAWVTEALVQHRTFHDTFLPGCSVHDGIALAALGGVPDAREQIAAFVGVVVGAELRGLRAARPAIAVVDWTE